MQNWINRFEHWQNGEIDVEEIPVALPGLPPSLAGHRILTVSDTHLHGDTPYINEIIALARAHRPHLIVSVGDLVDSHTKDLAPLARLLDGLRAVAPVFAVLGNNDYAWPDVEGLRRLYAACGALLLEDEMRTLSMGDGGLRVLGCQDPAAQNLGKGVARAEAQERTMGMPDLIARTADQGPLLLLMHRPHTAWQYGHLGVSLALSGHAHGGQFRLPWVGAVYAPDQGLFPKLTSGLYRAEDGLRLVVSRGIGNHGFPLRIGNRPHMPLLVLRADRTGPGKRKESRSIRTAF